MMAGPLDGVCIIDLTSVGMGPMATQLLGDFGADVVKVESPSGDVFRHVTPQRHPGMSHAFLNLNRNKRSVVIDAKTERGREQLRALIADADVFVSNMRASALRKLGLDADQLLKTFPRLVHCVCTGYAARGPYGNRPAVDDTIQAACGLAWLQGDAGTSAPRYVNSVVADKVVALYVVGAITAALFERERSGRGQAVEVPMFECMTAFVTAEHLAGRTFVPPEGPAGYARLLNAFRKPFRTLDGWLGVVPYTDAQWARFFALAGEPELANDPRFCSQVERSRHFDTLYKYVEVVLARKTTAQWTEMLDGADIPFAPVHSIDTLLEDEHLRATGFWQEIDHPTEGRLRQVGVPVTFSRTPATVRRHAPYLGEHTAELLPTSKTH